MSEAKKSNQVVKASLGCLAWLSLMCSTPALSKDLPAHGIVIQEIPIVASFDTASVQKSWFQRWFGKPELNEIVQQNDSPEAFSRMLDKHIAYRTEDQDVWSTADETWTRGYGDCEDFAICLQQLCAERALEAKVYVFFSSKSFLEGHAVTIGNWNGRLWMSSVGSYEEFDSMQDIEVRVAGIIGCNAKDLWNFSIAPDGMAGFITLKNAPQTPATTFSTAMKAP